MPWPTIGATQYHVQLRLPDKGRAIKGLVVSNNLDLGVFDLLNGLVIGCYQPSPEESTILKTYATKCKRDLLLIMRKKGTNRLLKKLLTRPKFAC